ncbi:MAG: leucyl/phenylalanyl-tRNA--protein transferase [Bacteroidetes bacterium]|nr:leucyl/phenylalanyl-tRNA--protein transferase [Bacteroidota bacterium]
MNILSSRIKFPPVEEADEDGLLAIGGELTEEWLLTAYRSGIFPWYNEDEPVCWWSPDPRCVLFPEKLHISKSMQKVIREQQFSFTTDVCFETVMRQCREVERSYGPGTWIQQEMIVAYTNLHKKGFAHSAEAWFNGKLVGGLYGVQIGKVFFGESMFSKMNNASKFAFILFVQQLKESGIELIDCQQKTDHLLSLGAEMISRKEFIEKLALLIPE